LAAYFPNGAAATVTVDMSQFSRSMVASWFDPTSGIETSIGSISNTGTHNFVQPSARGDATSDVVLVLR